MHIVLLVATERGRLFAETMFRLVPHARFTVCSFKEVSYEPPFYDAIKEMTERAGHTFVDRHVDNLDSFDLLFAVSWRYMVAPSTYQRARLGAYVFHDSLLPRYRGFSPTVWAMINRENRLGVSLIKMVEGVDEGDLVDQKGVGVLDTEYIGDVMPLVTQAYLDLIERNIEEMLAGTVMTSSQFTFATDCATYGCKRLPQDNRIDWRKSAADIHALIRATSRPYTGAFCYHGTTVLTVWRAEIMQQRYEGSIPGRVVKVIKGVGVDVLCGDGHVLRLTEIAKNDEVATADTFVRHITDTLT
jgi:methionyl-tRNA formyltransferase